MGFMKRLLVFITTVFLLSSSLFSFEWGGLFSNDSKGIFTTENDIGYVQSNALNLWLSIPISKDNKWKLSSEVSYKYELNVIPKPINISNIINVPLLKVSGSVNIGNKSIDLSYGRFKVSDYTSKIFNATCDGFYAAFDMQFVEFDCYVGYTGLTNRLAEKGFLGKNGVVIGNSGDFYVFEESYIPAIINITLPSLFANQSIVVQGLASFDCSSDKNNKFYGTFSLGGPILSSLFYDVTTTFASTTFKEVSNLSTISVTYFPKKFFGIILGVDYASGSELCFSNFSTVTSYSLSEILSFELSDVFVPSASLLFTASNFFAKFDVKGIMNFNDSIKTQAFAVNLTSYINVLSDIQLGLDFNALVDIEKKSGNVFALTFKGAFSF